MTSSWLIRAAGAAWRGNGEYCGTPGAGSAVAAHRAAANSPGSDAPFLAASIFLDILNVFLFFLQIFAGGRDN